MIIYLDMEYTTIKSKLSMHLLLSAENFYNALITASAYSAVFALPPRSPVIVCKQLANVEFLGDNELHYLSLSQHCEYGPFNFVSMFVKTHMSKHHDATQ